MTDDRNERERTIGDPGASAASTAPPGPDAPFAGGPPESGSASSGWTTPQGGFAGDPAPGAGVPPGYTSYRGYATPRPRPADLPSPGLAGVLGLIPGVGAMYNGQFAKGLAHLAIFAVLVSLADNVNGIFGVFVAGWIFYQAFEAYHTARARQAGLPLPNAFGLNDIGERVGFGKNWPYGAGNASTSANPASTPVPPASAPPAGPDPAWSQAQPYPPQTASYATPYGVPYTPPAEPGANWAGYIPPTSFAQAPAPAYPYSDPVVPPSTPPQAGAPGWSSVPFTPTAAAPAGAVPPISPAPMASGRRFPTGAVMLIVLGGIFLLSNVAPAWRLGERWLLPLLLAASAVWSLVSRLGLTSGARPAIRRGNLVCVLRLPAILFTLALLFFFQAAGWLTLGQSWPLLLIVLGALLLLERTLGRRGPDLNGSAPFAQTVTAPVDPVEGGVR